MHATQKLAHSKGEMQVSLTLLWLLVFVCSGIPTLLLDSSGGGVSTTVSLMEW